MAEPSLTVPARPPAGRYFLLACADDLQDAAEASETDNCRASAAQVTIAP
jgi:hypothetical protein